MYCGGPKLSHGYLGYHIVWDVQTFSKGKGQESPLQAYVA